jgi:hypothetical protein
MIRSGSPDIEKNCDLGVTRTRWTLGNAVGCYPNECILRNVEEMFHSSLCKRMKEDGGERLEQHAFSGYRSEQEVHPL